MALQSRGELTSDVIAAGHKVVHLNVTKSITGFSVGKASLSHAPI